MKKQNYYEINAISRMLEELEDLLNEQPYFSALFIALALPDALGKLEFPQEKKAVKSRYVKWFDGHVKNGFGLLYSDPRNEKEWHFDGEKCFQLRCGLLHEASNDISEKTGIEEFVLVFNDQRYLTGITCGMEPNFERFEPGSECVPSSPYIYLGVNEICRDILEAAKQFVEDNPNLDYPRIKMNRGGGKSMARLFDSKNWP